MAGFVNLDQNIFPLQDIPSVVKVFKQQLTQDQEPNLALLSIIAGAVENSLTCNRNFTVEKDADCEEGKLPAVEYRIVEALYMKFHTVIKGAVDVTLYGDGKYATRELVKKVSDVIWNSLTRSYYKDRAHLQSLFSYLTGNVKLAKVIANVILHFRRPKSWTSFLQFTLFRIYFYINTANTINDAV